LREAQELLEDAVRIDRAALALLGSRHLAFVARDINGLGLVARARGEHGAGFAAHQRAVELAIEALGERDPAVARFANNVAETLAGLAGAIECEAKPSRRLLREVAAVLQQLSENADERRAGRSELWRLLARGGFWGASATYCHGLLCLAALERNERALSTMRACNQEADPQYAKMLLARARLSCGLGRMRDGITSYRLALAIYEVKQGRDHPVTVDSRAELARIEARDPDAVACARRAALAGASSALAHELVARQRHELARECAALERLMIPDGGAPRADPAQL
jgi:hypothetical protein